MAVRGALAAGLQTPIKFVINWGRSVLETRSPSTPVQHIQAVGDLLGGLTFCGCSGEDTPYGVWQDTHMAHDAFAPGSLLGDAAIGEAVRAVKGNVWLGSKAALRGESVELSQRVAVHEDLLKRLKRAAGY